MSKSVYSLVLTDDVVSAADLEAGRLGMSRSALINRILAEALSCMTPQRRIESAFGELDRIIGAMKYLTVTEGGGSVFSVRSPITYKYNPTVRYSVAISDLSENPFGELRAVFRTQNPAFLQYLEGFFRAWHRLEAAYAGGKFAGGIDAAYSAGKYVRKLKLIKGSPALSPEQIGAAAAEYIKLLDAAVKIYFAGLNDINGAFLLIENKYAEFLKKNDTIAV